MNLTKLSHADHLTFDKTFSLGNVQVLKNVGNFVLNFLVRFYFS